MTCRSKAITAEQWRQLGYHYDRNDTAKEWVLTGSPFGLKRFVVQLRQYAGNAAKSAASEHDHWGPYSYLEIMTWHEAGIDQHSIFGTPDDLRRLAEIVEKYLLDVNVETHIEVSPEYSETCSYRLVLAIKDYGFDPARNDPQLWTDEASGTMN